MSNAGLDNIINRRKTTEDYHPHTLFWKKKIAQNGGMISSNSLKSVDILYRQIKKSVFFNKIKVLNPIIPDSRYAFQIPLIDCTGNYYWEDVQNFNSDPSSFTLTKNGASVGASSSCAFSSGFVPSSRFASIENGGATVYITETSNVVFDCIFGASNLARSASFLLSLNGDFFAEDSDGFMCFSQGNQALASNPSFRGYVSGNRYNANSLSLYKSSSSVSHVKYGENTDGFDSSLPTEPVYIFAENYYDTSSIVNNMDPGKRISFIAFHDALSSEESILFYNIIQKYRQRIGGGFV